MFDQFSTCRLVNCSSTPVTPSSHFKNKPTHSQRIQRNTCMSAKFLFTFSSRIFFHAVALALRNLEAKIYSTVKLLSHSRRFPRENVALKKLLWSAPGSFTRRISRLHSLFYLMIEKMRREWEAGGSHRQFHTGGTRGRRWAYHPRVEAAVSPHFRPRLDVVNRLSSISMKFFTRYKIERL